MKRPTLKQAKQLIKQKSVKLEKLYSQYRLLNKKQDVLHAQFNTNDRETEQIERDLERMQEFCKEAEKEQKLIEKLAKLPAGKCVFDNRFVDWRETRMLVPRRRFRRTYHFNSMGGNYIAINSKGKQKVCADLQTARRWASDKPIPKKKSKVDIKALNSVLKEAGYKVVGV